MQGLTFHARASTKFTPPLCRTPLRQKAGRPRSLSRMPNEDSGFDVISLCFRHVIRRFICIRLLGRHLMPLTTPSPRRSLPRLLNAAARGGLEPPPTRRLRRAYLHLPHSMEERFHFYISSPSFLRDTPLVHESERGCGSATPMIVIRGQPQRILAYRGQSSDLGCCKPSAPRLPAPLDDEREVLDQ